MIEKVEKITELTNTWYNLIGSDHHKDRDCHWYIETKWSYGNSPKYTIQHWGYILDDIVKEYPSYEEALKGLIAELTKAIDYIKEDSNQTETII